MLIFVISGYLVINVCCITPCGFFLFLFFFNLFNFLRQTKRRFAREIEHREHRRLILYMLLNTWFVRYATKNETLTEIKIRHPGHKDVLLLRISANMLVSTLGIRTCHFFQFIISLKHSLNLSLFHLPFII